MAISGELPPQLLSLWRFALQGEAGKGGTSQVWRAVDGRTGRLVAVKIAATQRDAALLADEAEALLLAESSRIPSVLDVGRVPAGVATVEPGRAFLALTWVEGARLDPRGLEDDERAAVELVVARDIGEALSDLHEAGTAHGDVKPSNVLLERAVDGSLRAVLIDLGFSTDSAALKMRGGTPRYLPPELATGRRQARAHDLWAFGVTLAEVASAQIALCDDPAAAIAQGKVPPPFDRWCTALTARDAGARPSASWVAELARAADGGAAHRAESHVRRVRASYVRVRRQELSGAVERGTVRLGPEAAPWLAHAVMVMAQVSALRGVERGGETITLGPLDVSGRLRWLAALVGSAAAAWPLDDGVWKVPEDRFGQSLERLAARIPPAAWTYRDVVRAVENDLPQERPSAAASFDEVQLALALVRRPVDPAAVFEAERWQQAGLLPMRHQVLLAEALRGLGEVGRALASLGQRDDAEAVVVRAELCRRAGDRQRAAELAASIAPSNGAGSERARAIAARVRVDEGDPAGAIALLGATVGGMASEARALAHLARGERDEAMHVVAEGLALAPDEETRARLACVQGMEAHGRGDAEKAFEAFARATDHAVRAGGVVEEATYRTGMAAAAVDAGFVAEALETSARAVLLWEHLQRPDRGAYAWLARASAYALVGADHDARQAADQARDSARAAGDARAEAFAWWVQADTAGPDRAAARWAAEQAASLLREAGAADDRLRAGARLLRVNGLEEAEVTAFDEAARSDGTSTTARVDWWGARAYAWTRGCALGRGAPLVAQVLRTVRASAPVGSKGPAVHEARKIAVREADGEAMSLLRAEQARLATALVRRTPPGLREHLTSVEWVAQAEQSAERVVRGDQARDLESLVRSLAARDNLRRLLEQVLDALVLWTGVERGVLLLRAPDERLVVRAARNLAREDLTGEQLSLSQSLARRALADGDPVVAVDAAGEASELQHSVHVLGLRSVLAVPLLARGEALGVVYLDDRVRRGAFGPQELAWVKLVAGIAAVAIVDARAQLLLRREARRAKRAQDKVAQLLAVREAELDVASQELAKTRDGRGQRYAYGAIVGRSSAMRATLDLVDRVTPTAIPVLLQGESGAGKELVARALHDNGPRARGPFVTENCSAIPETLLESTLFGHVRGAFTGADRHRVGLFEAADGGTLFLDEIGEMPLTMQSKLLRALQDGEVHPLGSSRARKVDARVIAATNRDLGKMVEQGRFREDLLYRMNVITITVPPLRAREDDVLLLAQHFVKKYGEGRAVRMAKEAAAVLLGYAWPGNVRQLENEVRRALVLSDGVIREEHLSPEVRGLAGGRAGAPSMHLRERVDALERELVSEAMKRTRGNQTRAAKLLGLSRFGLQKMMKRLELGDIDW